MRVELRPFTPGDAPAVASLLGAGPEISIRTATIPFPYSEHDARQFVAKVTGSGERAYAVVTKDDAVLVGSGGIIGTGDDVEIGYWIGKPYWGKGYATEVVAWLVEAARNSGSKTVKAEVFPDNLASARVLVKNGFAYDGQFERDLPLRGGLRRLDRFKLQLA